MSRRSLFAVTYVLIVAVVAHVQAHYLDPRIAAFNVPGQSNGEKTQTVSVGNADSKATCRFLYSTTPAHIKERPVSQDQLNSHAKDAPAPSQPAQSSSALAKLAALKGQCVTKRIDYWDYEICMETLVKQFHLPDTYSLGSFVAWDGADQIFKNGAACEARPDKAPRETRVKFACSGSAPQYLAEIKEVEMCKYVATVATPAVCGFKEFPVLSAPPPPQASRGLGPVPEAPLDDGTEDWVLQLSELADGRFSCQVYSTETRAAGSKIRFETFALALSVVNVPAPSDLSPDSTHVVIARRPGRVPVSAGEIQVEYSSDKRQTTLASSSKFNGQLAFAKIFA